MNKIRKTLVILPCLLMSVSLSGCSENNSGWPFGQKNDNETKATVELANVDYGFINAKQVTDDSQIAFENASKPTSFNVGENYYLIVSYSMTTREVSQGKSLINTHISFDNANFLDGFVYSAQSDKTPSKNPITNADTGDKKMELSVANVIPDTENGNADIKIVVRLATLQFGQSYLSCGFDGDGLKLTGNASGFSRMIEINKVRLSDPAISFDSFSLELKWANIANADYYKLYVDGVLKDGAVYTIDEYTSDGASISWDISAFVSGTHRVKIQAFSNSANYIISNYSNEVIVTL